MSSLQITLVAVAAVLAFWAVGAYNRLMGLRNAVLRGFVPVDEQLKARHALLQHRIDALGPALNEPADALAAVQAACSQVQATGAHARSRAAAAGAINSLRLAEGILAAAQQRLPAAADLDARLVAWGQQLGAVEAALQFARGQFNAAVLEYNRAVQQFPTSLMAGLFGFRPAGPL